VTLNRGRALHVGLTRPGFNGFARAGYCLKTQAVP
jgi:hypothetical protein